MRYILNYVNMPDAEVHIDMEFVSMHALTNYSQNYKGWTSLGVTVLPPNGTSNGLKSD